MLRSIHRRVLREVQTCCFFMMTSLRSLRGDLIASHRPKVRSTFDTAMGQNLNPWMASDDGDSITGGWCSVSNSDSLIRGLA